MWVAIGRFGRPHGVRGDIRFWPFNPETQLLRSGHTIQVGKHANHIEEYVVERIRFDAKGPVIKLAKFSDRDDVRVVTGLQWFENRDAFPELGEHEVYLVDLIGLSVRTEDGEAIGHVKDVLDIGPAEILVINHDGREVMVPNVEELVPSINLEAGEIIIRPIEGLLDG